MEEYTWKELCNKFNWPYNKQSVENAIKRAKGKGVDIEFIRRGRAGASALYRIIQCDIYNKKWVVCPDFPEYELTTDGDCRRTEDKTLLGNIDKNTGYVLIKSKPKEGKIGFNRRVHRLVMLTFKPIENSDKYVVDHINGIRSDNRLENLQWLLSEDNQRKKVYDRSVIQSNLLKIIQKYGYDKTNQILLNILEGDDKCIY